MLYNFVLASALQQCESAISVPKSIPSLLNFLPTPPTL